MTVAIVDVGMGNAGSVANMLRKVGVEAERTAEPDRVASAERIVLPGVGSYDVALGRLHDAALVDVIVARSREGTPLLGICLGMQLLSDRSEEGEASGLGLVPGSVRRLPAEVGDQRLAVPHMGWNTVDVARPEPLFDELAEGARYYFVHSYAFAPDDEGDVITRTLYGEPFVSAVRRGSVVGVQFHPEKSHRYGMELIRRFVEA